MQPNPYKAPVADLTDSATETKRFIWWKIYFFLITAISAIGLVAILLSKTVGWLDYLAVPISLIGTVGLFGYAFNRKILLPKFWLYFVVVDLSFSIAYEFLGKVDLSDGMAQNGHVISAIIGWLFSFPGYYAIFRYSSPSTDPWHIRQ
ncbi:MAG TPA: hypothetical protein VIF82_09565 [Burkholderiaceae bacterium]|jgi:hypothetical protein